MKAYIVLFFTAFAMMIGMTYVFLRGENQNSTSAQKNFDLFIEAKQVSSMLENDLLKSRGFLLENYDSIASEAKESEEICLEFGKRPDFQDKAIKVAVEEYCKSIHAKLSDIERFKTKNAIYRNSLYFVRARAKDKIAKNEQVFIQNLFTFILFTAGDDRNALEQQLLRPDSVGKDSLLLLHAQKLLSLKGSLDEIATEITQSPSDALLEKVRSLYLARYLDAETSASAYRLALFTIDIVLLLMMVYNSAKIWRTGASLAKANENMKVQVEEVRKANDAKSMFLANMSHELRTPMHSILNFAQIGLEGVQNHSVEVARDLFEEIYSSGQKLMLLLNDLLDLSKLEAGKMTYAMMNNDFSIVLDSIRSEFDLLAQKKNIEITIQNSAEKTFANFDNDRLTQVMRNLVSNAIKFANFGSEIKIVLGKDSSCLLVTVINSGPGIPEAELEEIFDKFVQSSKTRNGAGGTGLGLAICREIVTDHGGKIWARSEIDKFTEFSFSIPINRTEVSNGQF